MHGNKITQTLHPLGCTFIQRFPCNRVTSPSRAARQFQSTRAKSGTTWPWRGIAIAHILWCCKPSASHGGPVDILCWAVSRIALEAFLEQNEALAASVEGSPIFGRDGATITTVATSSCFFVASPHHLRIPVFCLSPGCLVFHSGH